MKDNDTKKAIKVLNKIMELELAGVVRYTHYSLMVYGYNRIPIVSWMKGNAEEGLTHAQRAGEMVTLLGGHPSLKIGALLETEQHDIGDILRESLEHEQTALDAYYELLKLSAAGGSVPPPQWRAAAGDAAALRHPLPGRGPEPRRERTARPASAGRHRSSP